MATFRGRALRVAIITSTIALTLAACSSGDNGASDTEPTSTETSASSTTTEPSASAEETTEASGDDATAEFVDLFSKGIEAMTTSSFTMEIVTDGQSMNASGVVDNSTTPASLSMDMTVPGAGPIKSINIDGIQYINMGEATGNMWMKMDPATMPDLGAASNPIEQLRAFENAVTAVTEVGAEDVNGIETTHYAVTIDSTKMTTTEQAVALPPVIDYDIWLDSEGHTVQLVNEIEAQGMQVGTTMTFADFGEPVTIEAPPADQITDMNMGG